VEVGYAHSCFKRRRRNLFLAGANAAYLYGSSEPVPYWAGFYLGVNGGYVGADWTASFTPNDANVSAITCGGFFGGTCAGPADNLNRVREFGIPLFEAVLTGAGERLRPVLMTAAVATAGMLPAAMATGIGSDVQRGVATVVAGGLILATLLTLFIIPTFYFVIERRVEQRHASRFIEAGA